jgi:hypothetical protein
LPEGTVSPLDHFCGAGGDDTLSISSTNLDSPLNDDGFVQEIVDNQLCVVTENRASLGVFYTDPGKLASVSTRVDAGSLAGSRVLRKIETDDVSSEFEQYTYAHNGAPANALGKAYAYGDPVGVYASPSGDPECAQASQVFAPLPAADSSGACSDASLLVRPAPRPSIRGRRCIPLTTCPHARPSALAKVPRPALPGQPSSMMPAVVARSLRQSISGNTSI